MTNSVNVRDQRHLKKSKLCYRCLVVWPKVPYQKEGSEIFRIEKTTEELLNSTCEVCQILGMALHRHQEVKPSMTRPWLRWERWLGHSGMAVFYDSDGAREGAYRSTGMIKVWSPEPSIADDWESVETEYGRIDFDPIKGWLDECSKSHIRCRLSTQGEPRSLRVIDCGKRSIVAAPVGCQYVALSYVWGGLVFNRDMKSEVLPDKLPRTLEDSMEATLLLGYQYLWIDAFCIRQDNAADKHLQIQQMDLIYTSAELTLIAAAGDDPSFGLPGVSSNRSLRYRDVTVHNIRVSYVPTNVYQSIIRSRWFTRGWTFQEGYLSPRRLYFTDSAVLFICNQMQENEGFQRHFPESEVFRLEGTLNSQVLGARSDGFSGASEVMRVLEQYSIRKLSYDYDALNAIVGVLNYHSFKAPATDTIWGIPYRSPPVGQPAICINWKHLSTAIRRPEYPSWSTIGWDGRVEFADISHQCSLWDTNAGKTSDHLDGLRNVQLLEHPRYIQITLKVHRFPVVNIVRSTQELMGDFFEDRQRAYLELTNHNYMGTGKSINLYIPVQWDKRPSNDYDSTQIICAVTHAIDLKYLSIMLLQDHKTHYERVGIAMANPKAHYTSVKKGAGLSKSTSTTKGIQTLIARDNPEFHWGEIWSGELDLAWIRDAEPVTITLG